MIREIKILTVRESEGLVAGLCPDDLVAFWYGQVEKSTWFDPEKEAVVLVLVNTKYKIQSYNLISLGNLNEAIMTPREVFRPAIIASAHSIFVLHNHPSGDAAPSPQDRSVCLRLTQCAELLGIPLLDFIVIGRGVYSSMAGRWQVKSYWEPFSAQAGQPRPRKHYKSLYPCDLGE